MKPSKHMRALDPTVLIWYNPHRTLDEFGRHLRETNIAELHVSQRKAAENKIQRAYRIMYDKEDCERFENALILLGGAKRDLKLLCQDIHSELAQANDQAHAPDRPCRRDVADPTRS